MKKTLEKINGVIDTWNDQHVRKFKDALYLDKDIGPLWITACNESQSSETPT
jgi:hypothetical protein